MKSKNILKIILKVVGIIFLIIVALFIYGYVIGTKGLKVREYKVVDNNLPDDFYGLKIVHISDIHYGFFFDIKGLEKVVKKVNELNPDIIIFTGDLIDKEIDEEEKQKVINELSKLTANTGKYAIKGNLDINSFDEIVSKAGFINLNDKYNVIYGKTSKFLIAGLSSNLNGNQNINDKLDNTYNYIENNEISFKILLMHEPDYIKYVNDNTFNIIFAGHSHNGQVTFPIIGALKTPNGSKKYYKEFYNTNKGPLYISGGIGTSVLPIRLFNKPSINFYRIVNK